jgi:hypothetical protein
MRPWQFALVILALLVTFDHIANDSNGVRDVAEWLVRTGRAVAGEIHRAVMTVFGE